MDTSAKEKEGAQGHVYQHELKVDTFPFLAMWENHKRFEIRKNDRDFKVGDVLRLRECQPCIACGNREYSGNEIYAAVTYLLKGRYGIPEGYCVMSIDVVGRVRHGR